MENTYLDVSPINNCIICLEPNATNIRNIINYKMMCECSYTIHEYCIQKWLEENPVCPYCKEEVKIEQPIINEPIVNANGPIINEPIVRHNHVKYITYSVNTHYHMCITRLTFVTIIIIIIILIHYLM